MEPKYNFDLKVGALVNPSFEVNLKKAIMYEHVEDYVVSNGFLCKHYHIKGASQEFVDYVQKLINRW